VPASRPLFLLSPAHLGGVRGRWLRSGRSRSATSLRLRQPGGLEIGEAFAFVSGLYFRGKLAYARRFGAPGGARVIAPGYGLVDLDWPLDPERLRRMHAVGVDLSRRAYHAPLARHAARLEAERVVLLGSLATGKYLDVLAPVLGERLLFPRLFVGAGDMRRGSLLLRAARSGEELDYAALPELPPRRR
jgi:hypothetical protein